MVGDVAVADGDGDVAEDVGVDGANLDIAGSGGQDNVIAGGVGDDFDIGVDGVAGGSDGDVAIVRIDVEKIESVGFIDEDIAIVGDAGVEGDRGGLEVVGRADAVEGGERKEATGNAGGVVTIVDDAARR